MRALSASDVLRAWEFGRAQHSLEQSLVLLALGTGVPRDRLATLPIGQRDALLLLLREITLGPGLECITQCPACSERVEISLDTEHIRGTDFPLSDPSSLEEPGGGGGAHLGGEREKFMLEDSGYRLTFRLPNSLDLATIQNTRSVAVARQELIQRCVLEATLDETPIDLVELPAAVETRLAERIVQADSLADIILDLTCPQCDHRWQEIFDIGMFFWTEIDNLAKRLLRDVHILARAYGWREPDILAMSAARRQAYLDMVAV